MSKKENVSAAKPKIGGAISVAPVGSKLPTDAKANLDAAFKSLGYIHSDGLENANSMESDSVSAWGGDKVLTLSKGKTDTFKYKLIEVLNIDVLKHVYGEENVKGTLETGVTIAATSEEIAPCAVVIDMVLRKKILKRIVIPSATISELGSISYKDDDAIGYEVTVSAEPDENGVTHHEYMIQKGA